MLVRVDGVVHVYRADDTGQSPRFQDNMLHMMAMLAVVLHHAYKMININIP
jgi:hypothetical protein